MPVPHDIVNAAIAILESAVPDPNVHRVPPCRHDASLAMMKLATEYFVLGLPLVFLAAKEKSGLDVSKDQIARLVIGGKRGTILQADVRLSRAIERKARHARIPRVPVDQSPAGLTVPDQGCVGRILTAEPDAHAIFVRPAHSLERLRDAIFPRRDEQHDRLLMFLKIIQPALDGGGVVIFSITDGAVIALDVPPTGERAVEFFVIGADRIRQK